MFSIAFYMSGFVGGAAFITAFIAGSRGDAGMVSFCVLSIIVSIFLSIVCLGKIKEEERD